MAAKDTVIFDLDGTLCDPTHRLAHLHAREYDTFNALCSHDPANETLVAMLRVFHRAKYRIVICTGRSAKFIGHTKSWLYDRRIPFDLLLMRPEGDLRPDAQVKRDLLEDAYITPGRVLAIFEDRLRVVEMWRRHGYTCLQHVEGNY